MSLKHLAFVAALAFALGGAAQAAPAASPDEIAAATHVAYAKKGGKHGWKHHGRGHHYGSYRGRGHHYGWYKQRRHHGWGHSRRHHGYAPTYRYGGGPFVTGSTRAFGGMHHPGKHKGWSKHGW